MASLPPRPAIGPLLSPRVPVPLGLFAHTSRPRSRDRVGGGTRPGQPRGGATSPAGLVCSRSLSRTRLTADHVCWCSDLSTGSHGRGRAFFPGPSVLALPRLAVPSGPREAHTGSRTGAASQSTGRRRAFPSSGPGVWGGPCHRLHDRIGWSVHSSWRLPLLVRVSVPQPPPGVSGLELPVSVGHVLTHAHTPSHPHTLTLCGQGTGPSLEQGCLPSIPGLPAGQALGVCTYPSSRPEGVFAAVGLKAG